MKTVLRTALTMLVAAVVTLVFVIILVISVALRVPHRPGSIYHKFPRWWASAILWASGVTVFVHGRERVDDDGGPYIFTSNHVSLFDILVLVRSLPQCYFVAKSELFRIPVFGAGMRAVGTIPIERNNQKSAFSSYDIAAERISAGSSVVVFPEGTRGTSYPIRPFKKGPFVLAVKAGVPIVPCVVHGTIEVVRKGSVRVTPGRIDLCLLDPVPTAGYSYEDRDALAHKVHDDMAAAMTTLHSNR